MIALLFSILATAAADSAPTLAGIKTLPGYKVSVYAYPLPGARELTQGPNGIVFVGNAQPGPVYALKPGKDRAAEIIPIGKFQKPNGVAFKNGDLYVAEIPQVWRLKDIEKNLKGQITPEAFGPKFPDKPWHGWKFIAFGPDGWLYVPVGMPCNVCEQDQETFGIIDRISPSGAKRERVAYGIRNTVGFDWNPKTHQLWFTDNGRDEMGDDTPPDELNRVTESDTNFGFPYCHGHDILDPQFGKGKDCADYARPIYEFPAHSASLGMRFVNGGKQILVAKHGSWNRTVPTGYEVVRLTVGDNGSVTKSEPFLTGFLNAKHEVSGRPVDVLELSDGSILVSDDSNGAVYRVHKD